MGLYVMSRSITEMGIGGRMENGSRDSCLSMLDDEEKRVENMMIKDDKEENDDRHSSDSSIGKNSDEDIDNDNDDDEKEVQSSFDSLPTLEETLPKSRKGLSKFFPGKTKSYPKLLDASVSSSINELAKKENIYTRRRKNALAKRLVFDKNKSSQLKTSGRVIKKLKSSHSTRSRNTMALALR